MLRGSSLAACLLWTGGLACTVESGESMTSLSGGGASSFTRGDTADGEAGGDTQASAGDTSTAGDTGEASATSSGDDSTSATADASSGATDASATDGGDGDGDGDAGSETSATGSTSGGSGDPLDPDLDVPPESNTPCSTPGSLNECGPLEVCRFYDSEEGRCESCTGCGNLNAFCSDGTDCDILFMCFQNTCTNFCTLGSSECGAVDACVNVGHPSKGVCQP